MGARLGVRVRIHKYCSCKCRYYNRSTRPWALDNTPTTELCMSRGPPRAHATISRPWNAWSMPSKRSRLTVASPIAVSGETRPFDSAVACIKNRYGLVVGYCNEPSFMIYPCEVESCLGSKSRVGCAHPDNDFVRQESHERSVI
jgi:hypothetical protein